MDDSDSALPIEARAQPPRDSVCREIGFGRCAVRVLDAVGAGVLVCDPDGTVLFLNTAGAQMLGVSRTRVVGSDVAEVMAPLDELHRLAADDRGGSAELWVNPSMARPLHVGFQVGTTSGMARAGSTEVVVLFRNISDFDRLRRERDRFLRLATVSRLLPTIAHELKNPLAGIQSLVEVLLEEVSETRQNQDLAAILAEVERLRLVVDGLGLADSDLMANAMDVDLAGELRSLVRLLGARAKSAGVTLTSRCAEGTAVRVNRSVLRLALLNLLNNALEASDAGDRVEVTASTRDGTVQVAVSDTGCGMPEEVRQQATELFFTTKARGSGIGLALVAEILRRGGCGLEIESAVGQGTTVRFSMPPGGQP